MELHGSFLALELYSLVSMRVGPRQRRLTELDGDSFFSLLFSFVRSKRAESDVLGTCSDLTFLLSHHATSHLF